MFEFCPCCGALIKLQEEGDYREFANAEDYKIIPADVIEAWQAGETRPLAEFIKELEEEGGSRD